MGDRARRDEILDTAAELFASTGFRTSLKDIADACGILPGSLYHHFDSKDALIVELVTRYQSQLDEIAERAAEGLEQGDDRPVPEVIRACAVAIADCASRNRAAILQTFYDPPATASDELVHLVRQTPSAITKVLTEIILTGQARGELRPSLDPELLAQRIGQSMLHGAVGGFYRSRGGDRTPPVKCRMLLDGLAVEPPDDRRLDRSAAFKAARAAISRWPDDDEDPGRASQLRAVARTEFGRRGYHATTIRDIAGAAGISAGAVYRFVGSKEELLSAIMASYLEDVAAGWDAVLASTSTVVEKLDALVWVDINVMHRFRDEFMIQLAWLRQAPPTMIDFGNFVSRLRHLQALLREGERAGAFRVAGETITVRAHCLLELLWVPDQIVAEAGPEAALALARDTLVRGATARS